MLRHKKQKHGEKDTEAVESDLSDTETTDSGTDHGMSDADEASDTGSQSREDQYDPWDSVVQKAFDKCQDQFEEEVTKLVQRRNIDEAEARTRVYLDMRSIYIKAISNVFANRMAWFEAIRKHLVYKAIKKTATNFVDLDNYSPREAWKSAIGQRKFLFDTILEDYNPPEIQGNEPDENTSDDDEPSAKRAKV